MTRAVTAKLRSAIRKQERKAEEAGDMHRVGRCSPALLWSGNGNNNTNKNNVIDIKETATATTT